MVPEAGVPLKTPPLLRFTPEGRLPLVNVKVAAGKPVAVIWKVVPEYSSSKVVVLALVMAGA